MRAWRKLHTSLLDSETPAALSDGAFCLFMLLIAAQDDSGYYPWTPTKIRRLTAARPSWSQDVSVTYTQELVDAGIAKWEEEGVVLVTGEKYNGRLRKDVAPELYLRGQGVAATDTSREQGVALDKRRVREDKEEEKKSSSKVPLEVTSDFKEEMVSEFSSRLGGDERVRQIIEDALNHKAMDKRKDKRLYLQVWLRREAEGFNGRAGYEVTTRHTPGNQEPDQYASLRERIKRQEERDSGVRNASPQE